MPTISASMRIQKRELPAHGDVVSRLYQARGLRPDEFALDIKRMLPPDQLKGVDHAARLIASAIQAGRRVVCASDMDADGACSAAIFMKGMRMLGATSIDYVVPDRFRLGYGLSEGLVDMAIDRGASMIVTADNGISSLRGVEYARSKNVAVCITDHHGCPADLPDADAIVNPQQPGCEFASKALCGAGTLFYVLVRVRQVLRDAGDRTATDAQLGHLLDFVALATVGDVVRLDYNNRVLVDAGLRRMRAGAANPGIRALAAVAGIELSALTAKDIGMKITPRINAAGRLEDITVGIRCLIADSVEDALPYARQLDELNRERRSIQTTMNEEADIIVGGMDLLPGGVAFSSPQFHEGVVGLCANKVKDQLFRPALVMAPSASDPSLLKASGRSIPGVNIRDALTLVDIRVPGGVVRHGGHAMACGATVRAEHEQQVCEAFRVACLEVAAPGAFEATLWIDGALAPGELTLETARALETAGPWGAGLDEPLFEGVFEVRGVKTMGADGRHVRYTLSAGANASIVAAHFGGADQMVMSGRIECLYRPSVNRWNGRESLQIIIERIL